MNVDEQLQLKNQICFRVYSLERAILAAYKPLLKQLDVTYPQYLVLLVLWEHQELMISEICDLLGLDTGTVSPLMKRMEHKHLIKRTRAQKDERTVMVTLTEDGVALRERAIKIPSTLAACLFSGNTDEALEKYHKLSNALDQAIDDLKTHHFC
jgi:DNA-binding MarR family transcriptional regulator